MSDDTFDRAEFERRQLEDADAAQAAFDLLLDKTGQPARVANAIGIMTAVLAATSANPDLVVDTIQVTAQKYLEIGDLANAYQGFKAQADAEVEAEKQGDAQ